MYYALHTHTKKVRNVDPYKEKLCLMHFTQKKSADTCIQRTIFERASTSSMKQKAFTIKAGCTFRVKLGNYRW